ncbi:unnamed protein product [Rotaria sordida]|uniref:Uncharacterized protein n=1 Tax=Rotaria sordida TaxID=392033 RepID=A0A813TKW8_9BILA|nr:unnamed protein product [Rotaria sordida]CAF0814344.1 unnamed protein product [Rotaria sordida]
MLRITFLSLILFVSLSSTSLLRKAISRRQTEPEFCHAIEGFDCKCTYYRVTCTSDRELPTSINILPNEKQKYQSVELVINGERAQNIHDYTFAPVKQLYKPDADTLEFRIKFEKFTELRLSSPSIFNQVFPDNLPTGVRKIMALEVYNPLVQPHDNVNLFSNLNVDSLELYVLYPFRGTFQQLFNGANIKYLRLSGGDIRSDLSQPFTGNIGRLEIAKQASQLSIQNFPAYPAHELIINAFYVTDFNTDHPPNYSNLGELRAYSQERIPANAFRQFPNLHTLSVSTEKDIDPHAFDGLHNLEKLTIKDTKPSLELLNNLPNIKEFEASVEKLNDKEQCRLIEKLANGQVAVQAIPNGHGCTCVSAYLDTASGRYPCDAQNCEQSSCAAIKNNFDASTRTFKTPPPIRRSDGTDALRPREPKLYAAPFQVSRQDQDKVQHAIPHHAQQQPWEQQSESQQQSEDVRPAGPSDKFREARPHTHTTTPSIDQQQDADEQDPWSSQESHDPSRQHPHDPSRQQQPHHPSQPQPYDPSRQQQSHDPSQQQPYDPSRQQQPHDPSQQQPYDPSRQQQPHDPSQQQPHDPSQQQPHDPSQQQPHDPSQQQPHDPSQQQPYYYPSQHQPYDPSRQQQPSDPSQQQPYDPSRQQQPSDPSQQQPYDSSQQQQPYGPSQQQEPHDPSQHQQPYDPSQQQEPGHPHHPDPHVPQQDTNQGQDVDSGTSPDGSEHQQDGDDQRTPDGEGHETHKGEGHETHTGGEGTEHQQTGEGGHEHPVPSDPNQSTEAAVIDATTITDVPAPAKKGFNWLLVIIIIAVVAALLLLGLIALILRKRRGGRGYNPAATSERGAGTTARA